MFWRHYHTATQCARSLALCGRNTLKFALDVTLVQQLEKLSNYSNVNKIVGVIQMRSPVIESPFNFLIFPGF